MQKRCDLSLTVLNDFNLAGSVGAWGCELTLDGYRAIGRKAGRSVQLSSRNQKDFTRRFSGIVKGVLSC